MKGKTVEVTRTWAVRKVSQTVTITPAGRKALERAKKEQAR